MVKRTNGNGHLAKLPVTVPLLTIKLSGSLEGHTIIARGISFNELRAMQQGEIQDTGLVSLLLDAVSDHSLDIDDLGSLSPSLVLEITNAWLDAQKEAALPPASAER